LPTLRTLPLDAPLRIEADFHTAIASAALATRPQRLDAVMLTLAERHRALGNVARADEPESGAICSLLWQGTVEPARELFDATVARHLPPQLRAVYELVLRAVEGHPWSLAGIDDLDLTTLHLYDRALIHLLRHETAIADSLLRERYADRKRTSGSTRQRFSPYFPGALISALGPPDAEPDVAWLLGWIHEPPFPGLWVVHRAICALLLSERAEPPEPGLADAALRILDTTDADVAVRGWIEARARSGA
jgi:hypothetical protein